MQVVLETLWFFLPAMIANMAPVLVARYKMIESFNIPVDRGIKLNGIRLFGDHKTVRGFVVGLVCSAVMAIIQYLLFEFNIIKEISIVNYSSVWLSLIVGLLLGFGALLGDSFKSFFKRQLHIMPGHSWPFFDQIDFVLGALLLTFWINGLSYGHAITAIIILGFSSYVVSVIGVITRLKNSV